jgi:hypothetical protein
MPGERIKLGLLCLLLLFMLGIVCFTAVGTYQAVRSFQQQDNALEKGDVSTISGWMTIHVIARLYHIPEEYLSHTLAVGNPDQLRHFTLNQIASNKRQLVNKLIHTLQHAILDYRKAHHTRAKTPALKPKQPQQSTYKKSRSVKPVSERMFSNGTKSHLATTGRT